MANTKKKSTTTVIEQRVKPIPKPSPEIGIDVDDTLFDDIITASQNNNLNTAAIEALSNSAQNREQTYELIDSMAHDGIIAAVLNQYTEDTIQMNDRGETIWIESDDGDVLTTTSWLLETLNIEKHLHEWTHCLVEYGDVYVRLFRKSDVQDDVLFKDNKHNRQLNEAKETMNEDTVLRVYANDDPYANFVQMVPNPGEMFDLQKFGKTQGYIKTPVRVIQATSDELYKYLTRYKMNKHNVEIYDATAFAHAYLDTTTQRQPETVEIYLDENTDTTTSDSMTTSYDIKRGQSTLYDAFKIWRQMNLLEMSALLNRVTQSAVTRVIGVKTPNMARNQKRAYLQRLKEQIEQKSAMDVDGNNSYTEYTNPSAILNTIYLGIDENDQGNISVTTIGGDFDPKSLVDIEYFRDRLFGALKMPKQFFGFTDDSTGFNGGTSLTILDARYGKTIKTFQEKLCGLVTDILNLYLIDRGLDTYVNRFRVRMQTPVTQEELDRRTNNDTRIRFVTDLMQQFDDIEDPITKLKIKKSLLTPVVNDNEVIGYFQDYIDEQIRASKKGKKESADSETSSEEIPVENNEEIPELPEAPAEEEPLPSPEEIPMEDVEEDDKELLVEDGNEGEDSYLPSPEELGLPDVK